MMEDREEEDLQMALRMSLHGSPPERKRCKPIEVLEESPEARNRRLQRELRASAAEKRISMTRKHAPVGRALAAANATATTSFTVSEEKDRNLSANSHDLRTTDGDNAGRAMEKGKGKGKGRSEAADEGLGMELSQDLAKQLFSMLFGSDVSKGILARWSNQGIRFSSDPDTCIGLVQHEGGPCGVLAALQAFVLKYLLFFPEKLKSTPVPTQQNFEQMAFFQNSKDALSDFTDISEDIKRNALVLSMVEILFSCGSKKRAAIVTLDILKDCSQDGMDDDQKDEIFSKALEDFTIESASDLHRMSRVNICTSEANAFRRLMADLPIFQSRMGAILFLASALLSRGLDLIQADRDDPSLPLVTTPFGHASQEIVNLLLCGQAVPNVFDDKIDLGGGMFLKGIAGNVEVGFLTLLESLNFCKVGRYLKCPRWPIWVVGSESHYSVLFALDTSVQDENKLEQRESMVRTAFNNEDQSGGGGFLTVESFDKVLREMNIILSSEKLDALCCAGYVVWSDFWQVLLDLDKSMGGLKDSNGLGKKQFDIYHFNGIAKSVPNGSHIAGNETPIQKPRLSKLAVTVPPRWTQEEFMADVLPSNMSSGRKDGDPVQPNQLPEPAQHAPLVDCIRTRWPRATCNWVGDPPSIV